MSDVFRFLDLPSELRLKVYEHLFAGAELIVDVPRRLVGSKACKCSKTGNDTNNNTCHDWDASSNSSCFCWNSGPARQFRSRGASIPGLLLASKALRTEALPVFSLQLTLHLFDCFSERPDEQVAIPDHYLEFTRTVAIRSLDPHYDLRTMPRLTELIFCVPSMVDLKGGPGVPDADIEIFSEVADIVVRDAIATVESHRVIGGASSLLDRIDKPDHFTLPDKVKVRYPGAGFYCPKTPFCDEEYIWKDVVVDYHTKKIISHGGLGLSSDCGHFSDYEPVTMPALEERS
ncbi:uncharacterized protein AB675_9388 [Cyphellophora attinorum]|uniref:F-box domain-containing protein n=1 Tax=Cyphellophora attinorum TaxID=1664694 RepID=A0A0N1P153_9EURO|nr:uncharacterized protein AB675_9388 [Phialophora attinorum]KPI41602.1 hypothetical protein AB675_9388 [Phialophora attinorum]